MKLSIIIPVYNEAKVISNCINSLLKQTITDLEIILIDDGSTDDTLKIIESLESQNKNLHILKQDHKGPGAARNLGVKRAMGETLVFVDADMEFAPDFIEKLTLPIISGQTIGTFSKEEYLLNKNSNGARFWNLNLNRDALKMHPENYPDEQNVFRAILKTEFEKAGGFDPNLGYTDDWSLARKLNKMATFAPGAKYFHNNPETLSEVWHQARWFGKNEFLTGSFVRKFYNLWRYNPPLSLFKGIFGAIKYKDSQYIAFKLAYDTAVFTSVLLSFFGERKSK